VLKISWEQALAAADQYHARLRGIDNPAWGPWRSLKALALDGLERREEACALLEQELEAAHRWGAPGALARTLRLLGTLRREDGHDLLREAVLVNGEKSSETDRHPCCSNSAMSGMGELASRKVSCKSMWTNASRALQPSPYLTAFPESAAVTSGKRDFNLAGIGGE